MKKWNRKQKVSLKGKGEIEKCIQTNYWPLGLILRNDKSASNVRIVITGDRNFLQSISDDERTIVGAINERDLPKVQGGLTLFPPPHSHCQNKAHCLLCNWNFVPGSQVPEVGIFTGVSLVESWSSSVRKNFGHQEHEINMRSYIVA